MKGRAASVRKWALLLASGVVVALVVIALLAVVGSSTSQSETRDVTVSDGRMRAQTRERFGFWRIQATSIVEPLQGWMPHDDPSQLPQPPAWRRAMLERTSEILIYDVIELGRPWPIATSQPTTVPADRSWTSITPRRYHFGPLSIEWPGYIYWPGLLAWISIITAAWALAWVAATIARSRIRRARGQCLDCGYSLAGISGERCPECGSNVAHDR